MSKKEIRELIDLKAWTQAELARQLDVDVATVCKWLSGENPVGGPARILMRQWLDEARRMVEKQPA
jgi:DNA-binding transcriptional regulator YiaG